MVNVAIAHRNKIGIALCRDDDTKVLERPCTDNTLRHLHSHLHSPPILYLWQIGVGYRKKNAYFCRL